MKNLIDGNKIANRILRQLKSEALFLRSKNIEAKLSVVLVGDDPASETYVKKKKQACEKIGIDFSLHHYPADISKEEIIKEITKIQKKEKPSGLIIQLPLPKSLHTPEILNAVHPEIDVDCLTNENTGKLVMKTGFILPPTPYAIKTILKDLKINVKGENICIIGAGALVGKPLSIILANKGATITLCNENTKNIKKILPKF